MSDLKEDDADAVEYRHLHLERDLKLYSKLLAELDATREALRSAKADTDIDTCPNLNAEPVVGTVFSVLSTLRSARAVKSKVDAWNESLRIKSLLIEKRSKPFTRDLFVFLSSSLSARSAAARWPNSDAPLAASSRSGFDDWYSNWVLPRYVCDESDGEAYATEMQFLKDRRAIIERRLSRPYVESGRRSRKMCCELGLRGPKSIFSSRTYWADAPLRTTSTCNRVRATLPRWPDS